MGQTDNLAKFFSHPFLTQKLFLGISTIISAIFWYFANDLSGNFGYLMWFAPIGIILGAFYTNGTKAFITAFIAYFIGWLSWFSYLVSVITLVPTLIFTIFLSLVFASIIIATRKIVFKTKAWYSVFAFPVFFTTFEFLFFKFSPDGTAGSIAYSQSNFLPIIQVASLTGSLGITFLITLIPSTIALAWYFRMDKIKLRVVLGLSGLFLLTVLLYGTLRLNKNIEEKSIKVGLVVLEEKYHHITNKPDPQKEKLTTELYTRKATELASQGAKIIVLPERAVNITKETEKDIINEFSTAAKQNNVFIVVGYTNFRTTITRNSALVFDGNGTIVTDYDKVHLVNVLEDQFTSGKNIGLFNYNNINAGAAICKDLDFPDYIKNYANTSILAIPAWDFVVDGWLHSRMAVLRGVENGFSAIRAARQGRLTISNSIGSVTSEADCSNGQEVTLLGNVSLSHSNTFYSRYPNWFGLLNLGALALLLFALVIKNKKLHNP